MSEITALESVSSSATTTVKKGGRAFVEIASIAGGFGATSMLKPITSKFTNGGILDDILHIALAGTISKMASNKIIKRVGYGMLLKSSFSAASNILKRTGINIPFISQGFKDGLGSSVTPKSVVSTPTPKASSVYKRMSTPMNSIRNIFK